MLSMNVDAWYNDQKLVYYAILSMNERSDLQFCIHILAVCSSILVCYLQPFLTSYNQRVSNDSLLPSAMEVCISVV